MVFSRSEDLKKVEKEKINRAKIQAKLGVDASGTTMDIKIKRPDEVRDAQQGNYTVMVARIKKEMKEHYDLAIKRRKKNVRE